jgi:hypothetical protein
MEFNQVVHSVVACLKTHFFDCCVDTHIEMPFL